MSIRSALYNTIQKRLVRRLQCDDSPSIAAALLYPGYHNSMMRLELGASKEAVKSSSEFLISWLLSYLSRKKDDNDVDEMVVDPAVPDFFSDTLTCSNARVVDWKAGASRIVSLLFASLRASTVALPPSVAVWDVPGAKKVRVCLDEQDESMRQFYTTFALANPADAESVLTLHRKVLSLPAGGGAVECVFSGASRLDAPTRNRMSEDTFCPLAVVQRWVCVSEDKEKIETDLTEHCRLNLRGAG